jgi:hypothetical protein
MANQNTSSSGLRRFDKELNEDISDFHLGENQWTQARNAINNSATGDLGKLGNEPANRFCKSAPYPVIGAIHLDADEWVIFSTDDVNSEIGKFKEDGCKYDTIVNDTCLGFDRANLIKGVSRATSDCTYKIYWDDGKNPSRVLDINDVPWIQNCTDENGVVLPGPANYDPVGCITCIDTNRLDCEKIRLARLIQPACYRVEKGTNGGTLPNGSYFIVAAYCIGGEKISDYFTPSNVQPLFEHQNIASSLNIFIENTDPDYDEIEIVLVSIVNLQTVARRVGVYSTNQKIINLDIISPTWDTIPIESVPILTTVYNKSDAMYNVNTYLLRVGPTSKLDFNYQPLANQIVTKWISTEYPEDYYKNGGSNVGYMRDEVYAFFIRWIYDTGDKTPSYHIPGRPAFAGETALQVTDALISEVSGGFNFRWQVENTASITSNAIIPTGDGGFQIAEGYMGYWESTEEYPDKMPEIWNASAHCWSTLSPSPITCPGQLTPSIPYVTTNLDDYDLCGEKIRHHKFPDCFIGNSSLTNHFIGASPNFANTPAIRIMGVKFENVRPPVDNDGKPIPGIIGYEILRGSRQGNRTVLAKGLISNMAEYTIEGNSRTGLYPNYPYNDLRIDPFLSTTQTDQPNTFLGVPLPGNGNYTPMGTFRRDIFTFHSPDTNFFQPFLSGKELKVVEEMASTVVGKFEYSEKHPRAKLISNTAFFTAVIVGIGLASQSINGERRWTYKFPSANPVTSSGFLGPAPSGLFGYLEPAFMATWAGGDAAVSVMNGSIAAALAAAFPGGGQILNNVLGNGLGPLLGLISLATAIPATFPTNSQFIRDLNIVGGVYADIPLLLRQAQGIPTFLNFWSQGADTTLNLIKAFIRFRDYALKYNSVGKYTFSAPSRSNERRRTITEQSYLSNNVLNFGSNYTINNLYRSNKVVLELDSALGDPITFVDNTRQLATSPVANLAQLDWDPTAPPVVRRPTAKEFETTAANYYVAYKQRLRNQYGQVDGIIQVPVGQCYHNINRFGPGKTDSMFSGDTYVGRFAEKDTFFYFYEWLYDQPDGFGFDYLENRMLPYPRFWMSSQPFELSDAITGMFTGLSSVFSGNPVNTVLSQLDNFLPTERFCLDGYNNSGITGLLNSLSFAVRNCYFYLFNSGVKYFFVESEINVDLRDYGDFDNQKHYPILGVKELFNTALIKDGNFYRYDPSLGISKTYLNYTSWAKMQPRTYDPGLASSCYVYKPNQVIYSLPTDFESGKDNWYFFLANNYYEFLSRVTCIKPINRNGALILFESDSPTQFLGVDELQTTAGTKLTIGDGGLFSQPMQSLMNADRPYEYASCQNRLSVINTPMGIYWMSQNQGKIFSIAGGLKDLSGQDLKWWFANYLPYRLLKQGINNIENFELLDNPVIGIGCQSTYDNTNQLLYFSKKDYVVKSTLPPNTVLTYVDRDNFLVNDTLPIKLGDPMFFDDASWTVSYDPKTASWISWHDWHPDLMLPGKNTFLTIKNTNTNPALNNGIWVHNDRCDLYCNYYGIDYPFEVEWMVHTANQVNSLRSVEYVMEVYKYADNCYDRFHVLDYNFDEAVVYNTEQCSGLLKLNLNPKNNAPVILNYPQINPTNISILYSKEEQKYRFNQFWDITDSRGEFPIGLTYPPPPPIAGTYAQRMIWNTSPNGYVRTLNPNNLNYQKDQLERKKFRHYVNFVFLRRLVSGDRKMLVMLATNKNLYSPR